MDKIPVTKEQFDKISKCVDEFELSLDGFQKGENGYGACASKKYEIRRLFKVNEVTE